MVSLDRNYRDVINLLFVLPGLYLNILKIERMLQFWDEKFSTCVAHAVKPKNRRNKEELAGYEQKLR